MTTLNRNYFKNFTTVELAKDLLGKVLVHESEFGSTTGMIVETEAYLVNDPAAHSYIGRTKRNNSVFEEGGTAYVYFIYGVYYCINVSAHTPAEGVLIRALEPIIGQEIMEIRLRSKQNKDPNYHYSDSKLLNGPGKLCIGMGIDRNLDGHKLWNQPLYLVDQGIKFKGKQIETTKRIGISKAIDLPLRFYIKGSKFISKK